MNFQGIGQACRRRVAAVVAPLLSLVAGCQLWESPIYPRPASSGVGDGSRIRVLFIGNSLTYYNDLPGLVQQFSLLETRQVEVASVTRALASLQWHWSHGSARERLASEPWDLVVLQDYSTMPVDHSATSVEYFTRFDAEVRRRGATPIIFENWLRASNAGSADRMTETYRTIEARTHAAVAGIGSAWRTCAATNPQIKLLKDDRHPKVAGTYLAACVLYKLIYNKPATGLPTAISGLRLRPEIAFRLQQIADEGSPHAVDAIAPP